MFFEHGLSGFDVVLASVSMKIQIVGSCVVLSRLEEYHYSLAISKKLSLPGSSKSIRYTENVKNQFRIFKKGYPLL